MLHMLGISIYELAGTLMLLCIPAFIVCAMVPALTQRSLKASGVLAVFSLALFANHPFTYAVAIFILATTLTELEFLQNLAAIFRGGDYFDYQKTRMTQAEILAKQAADEELLLQEELSQDSDEHAEAEPDEPGDEEPEEPDVFTAPHAGAEPDDEPGADAGAAPDEEADDNEKTGFFPAIPEGPAAPAPARVPAANAEPGEPVFDDDDDDLLDEDDGEDEEDEAPALPDAAKPARSESKPKVVVHLSEPQRKQIKQLQSEMSTKSKSYDIRMSLREIMEQRIELERRALNTIRKQYRNRLIDQNVKITDAKNPPLFIDTIIHDGQIDILIEITVIQIKSTMHEMIERRLRKLDELVESYQRVTGKKTKGTLYILLAKDVEKTESDELAVYTKVMATRNPVSVRYLTEAELA